MAVPDGLPSDVVQFVNSTVDFTLRFSCSTRVIALSRSTGPKPSIYGRLSSLRSNSHTARRSASAEMMVPITRCAP